MKIVNITMPIPDLGIIKYTVSSDMKIGSDEKGRFQGVRVEDKHYLIRMEDIQEGTEKNGMHIPPIAYELVNIEKDRGKIKDVIDPITLEKIAASVHGDEFSSSAATYLKPQEKKSPAFH